MGVRPGFAFGGLPSTRSPMLGSGRIVSFALRVGLSRGTARRRGLQVAQVRRSESSDEPPARRGNGKEPVEQPVYETIKASAKGGVGIGNSPFELKAPFQPTGDQPEAIRILTEGVLEGVKNQTLIGATGTGKTFVMANVIANVGKPTLVLAPNKTLAAQLRNEIASFFPTAAVEYFVSYYDYYQPEAFSESSGTYISKASSINSDLDRFRISATRSLYERRDVVIVASVSCIYGLGMPSEFLNSAATVALGDELSIERLVERIEFLRYSKQDLNPERGEFAATKTCLTVGVSWEDDVNYNIEVDDGKVSYLSMAKRSTPSSEVVLDEVTIYPTGHFIIPEEQKRIAVQRILKECKQTADEFRAEGKAWEASLIQDRVAQDMKMVEKYGSCAGIENYSRHMAGREAGETPDTLLDYFPVDDWLLIVDESHVTVPQVKAMSAGDRARKENLVKHGYRLPSALDNRPLNITEFWDKTHQTIFVSATPADFEVEVSRGRVVQQLIRPTGILDPVVQVKPTTDQIDVLLHEAQVRISKNQRVLVTTLTKRMAEDLCDFLNQNRLKASFIHSDVDTLARLEILDKLNLGEIDIVVGVNLLREGLDLPKVSLVAIMDADKEGFLRSETALMQTIGRAARHVEGHAILFADQITRSMDRAISETQRRRAFQSQHNLEQHSRPSPISVKMRNPVNDEIPSILDIVKSFPKKRTARRRLVEDNRLTDEDASSASHPSAGMPRSSASSDELHSAMRRAASEKNFELAAKIRDRLRERRANASPAPASTPASAPVHG